MATPATTCIAGNGVLDMRRTQVAPVKMAPALPRPQRCAFPGSTTSSSTSSSTSSRPHARFLRTRASASSSSSAGEPSPVSTPTVDMMQSPSTCFPNTDWPFQKAAPKTSLDPAQAAHAGPLSLNLIEFVHWCAFPAGFCVAQYIFVHAPAIAVHTGGDVSRVFFLMLGLLCQVMGGICGIQMHMYEGWQVAPFRNLLNLPANDPAANKPTGVEINDTRVPEYNNAWLRAVAYQILFTFQTLGLTLFSLGVFGYTPQMLGLVGISVFVAVLWRRKPQLSEAEPRWFWKLFCERNVDGVVRPIMPLSVWLFVTFIVNTLVSLYAYKVFFGPVLAAVWPPSLLPWLAPLRSEWWGVLPALVVAVGGFVEGYFAESGFNQWVHGLAVVIMCTGVLMHYPIYWHMVRVVVPV